MRLLIFAGISLFLAAGGAWMASVEWKQWQVHRAVQAGSQVRAVVVGPADCPAWWGGCGRYERGWTVRFRAKGRRVETAVAAYHKDRHVPGSRMAVRYDPDHPEHAEDVRHGSRAVGGVVAGLVLVLVGLSVAILGLRRFAAGTLDV